MAFMKILGEVLTSWVRIESLESNTYDRIRYVIDNAVITVKNCMHDAISTAMNNLVIPRVEIAVRSITGWSGKGPKSIVQNPDRSDFTGDTENTPLRSASKWFDLLNIEQDDIDETGDFDNSEDSVGWLKMNWRCP